jgi:glycine/D-amino acid oxidase-like deaminating enzyme
LAGNIAGPSAFGSEVGMDRYDVIIVGGGIAGASAGFALADAAKVLLNRARAPIWLSLDRKISGGLSADARS